MKSFIVARCTIAALLVLLSIAVTATAVAQPGTAPEDSEIRERLRTTIIPRIQFEDATLPQALGFLRRQSREVDENSRAVNIILHLRDRRPDDPDLALTLDVERIPLGAALRYIAFILDLNIYVDAHAVVITDQELER